MGMFDFFIKDVETKDAHSNPIFRTHYYKSEYRDAKDAILRYLNNQKMTVKNINDTFGEILVEESGYHMIISIKKVSVLETAIDMKINVYGIFGAFKPHRLVKELYSYLDKQLRFTGVGLNS